MNEENKRKKLNLIILADDPENATALNREINAESADEITLDSMCMSLKLLSGAPDPAGWIPEINQADIILLSVRHIDVLSVEKVKVIYQLLPQSGSTSVGICILRDKDETDFKMSCPFCAQKLWVRDSDVDKRGRCPNCKKAFTLPSQAVQLSSFLDLPNHVSVYNVILDNPDTSLGVLHSLASRFHGDIEEFQGPMDSEAIKKTTVRIQPIEE